MFDKRSIREALICKFNCSECEKDDQTCRQDLYTLYHHLIKMGYKKFKKNEKKIELPLDKRIFI